MDLHKKVYACSVQAYKLCSHLTSQSQSHGCTQLQSQQVTLSSYQQPPKYHGRSDNIASQPSAKKLLSSPPFPSPLHFLIFPSLIKVDSLIVEGEE